MEILIKPLVCAGRPLGLCCRQGLSSKQQLYSSLNFSRANPVAQQAREQSGVSFRASASCYSRLRSHCTSRSGFAPDANWN